MKSFFATFFFTSVLLLTILSCKKTAAPTVWQTDLEGKWRITRIAVDSNQNGILDNNEMLAPTSYDSTHFYSFGTNGKGSLSYLDSSIANFSWNLLHNSTCLQMVYTGAVTGTFNWLIDTLSDEAMTLRDTTAHPITWNLYTRQH